jgi:hypothetical protein
MRNFVRLLLTASFLAAFIILWPMAAVSQSSNHLLPEPLIQSDTLLITHTLYLPFVSHYAGSFGYGVQADPRGNTTANIGHIQAMGLGWAKFAMNWEDVETSPHIYSWELWDDLIASYHAQQIRILLSISRAPDWARPSDDDKSVEGLPADPATYAAFVAQVAERYRGQVQAIEIWSDQNLWYAVGGADRINPATYVQLLQAAYQAIKAVDANIKVISGGLTPAGDVGDIAIDDISYLQAMYQAGAKSYFDAVGAHPAGYNCPAMADWQTVEDPTALFRGPFENRHHSWCFRGTMEGYRNVMVANGDAGKDIVPTEFGWAVSDSPAAGYEYARDNTYEEQAQWTVEAFQAGKQWGWVGPMFLWNLDYGVTAAGTELAQWSLLQPDGPVPAYMAIAGMPK